MKIGPGRAPRCNRFPAQSLGIGAMAHLRSPVKGANRTRWVVPLGLLSPGWKAAGLPDNCRVGAPLGREGSAAAVRVGWIEDKKGIAIGTTTSSAEPTRRDFLY